MGREEQVEEREVLNAIFLEEITDISEVSFRISITMEAVEQDNMLLEPVTMLLTVTYPTEYPDQAPLLELAAPPNAPKHAFFDLQADKDELLSALNPTINENLGMQMVYTLVSTLKDLAEALIASRLATAQAARDADAAEAEAAENAKFHGERVTRESFLAWRERFRAEMLEDEERRRRETLDAEEKKRGAKKEEQQRWTGRMLWEKGLIGKGEDEADLEAEVVKEVAQLTVEH